MRVVKTVMAVMLTIILTARFWLVSAGCDESGDAYTLIYEGLAGMESEIELDGLFLTRDDLREVFTAVYSESPELFFVSPQYRYSAVGEYVSVIVPDYIYTAGEAEVARRAVGAVVRSAVATVPDGADDYTKMRILHDCICNGFDYSESGGRDVFEFIALGCGVCQAYTGLYRLMLDAVGIESGVAASAEMRHIWNVVRLGDEYYHIDVTWDDTGGTHDYFLKSDEYFKTHGHGTWNSEFECKKEYVPPMYSADVNCDGLIDCLDVSAGYSLGFADCELEIVRKSVVRGYLKSCR